MPLPKRKSAHATGDRGWIVFAKSVPEQWITREISKNDYGIDGQVEMVSLKDEVTGDLAFIQVKGTKEISWKNKPDGTRRARVSVRKETVFYWLNLPVPVFLVLADTTQDKAYFVPVKHQVRKNFLECEKKNSFAFFIDSSFELNTEHGLMAFVIHQHREKHYDEFHSRIRELLMHYEEYLQFIRQNQGWEDHEVIELDDMMTLEHIYDSCRVVSQFFAIEWNVPSLKHVCKTEAKRWKRDEIHGVAIGKILAPIEPIFRKILDVGRAFILEGEGRFWKYVDSPVYTAAYLLKLRPPAGR